MVYTIDHHRNLKADMQTYFISIKTVDLNNVAFNEVSLTSSQVL